MDEGLLNDLLECSVCLERLDTSSRVLPCQHTFCLKCLKVIVESHKELRCPECRVLVDVKVDELPPNVLLMRILEGMKNSGGPRRVHPQQTNHQNNVSSGQRDSKQVPHARALYDYQSNEPGDLSFKKGELILLVKKLDRYWYKGECTGRSGMFPITFVQVLVPLHVPAPLCKALYDFRMSAPDEEGCLSFDKDAIISVHRRVDENWAEGRVGARIGIFPLAFVELNHAARELIHSTPLNRAVPPTPADPGRPAHSDLRHLQQHAPRYQNMTMSTPATGQANHPIVAMSQSHPNYVAFPAPILSQPVPATRTNINQSYQAKRNILETQMKHANDLIHFNTISNKSQTMALQSVSRINEFDRLRTVKYENTTPVKAETTYQNVRCPNVTVSVANFNNMSSDSSSSVNTTSVVSSTTTPNTSSNTSSSDSAEPSLPSSPDNVEQNSTVIPADTTQNSENTDLNNSMGVLSLNESSTATNTSLNVSLPPTESPKNLSAEEGTSNNEPSRLDVPSSSKTVLRTSGPESFLNFGLGLQAALSPSHKDVNYMVRMHRERDKRHSLTPSSHLQENHTVQNRHSAEILATSLLDHTRDRERDMVRPEREREKRRRRSRSNEQPLPAAYIAMYSYRPQKPDELELKKGGVYMVSERCRDGWFKGWAERGRRAGVFPGNYLAPTKLHDISSSAAPKAANAPETPPRDHTPPTDQALVQNYYMTPRIPSAQPQQSTVKTDKTKEKPKSDKSMTGGVSLMKRLAAMKKCKSPPPATFSVDNPVFDEPGTSTATPQHVRSGSCPSQLLRAAPGSERLRHKERPSLLHHLATNEVQWQSQHRKSQSLDVTAARRERHHSQPVKERFRCIVPYPPNSEYELELKLDDIVMVFKKRGDGWYKGTLQRTGRTGLFPASFVQRCPQQ